MFPCPSSRLRIPPDFRGGVHYLLFIPAFSTCPLHINSGCGKERRIFQLVQSLNRENHIPLSPYVPENLISWDGFSRPVPRQPAHIHTQAESGDYLYVRDSSRVPRRRTFVKAPYAIEPVPSLSGHAIAYRWRSLPRVRRHRASKPQGSFERVLPW